MTDNKYDPQETELSEAEKRAARIKAIRSAIQSGGSDEAQASAEKENASNEEVQPQTEGISGGQADAVPETGGSPVSEEPVHRSAPVNRPAPAAPPHMNAPSQGGYAAPPRMNGTPGGYPQGYNNGAPVPPNGYPQGGQMQRNGAPVPPNGYPQGYNNGAPVPPNGYPQGYNNRAPVPPNGYPQGGQMQRNGAPVPPNRNAAPGSQQNKKKKKKKKTFGQAIRGLFPEKGDSVLERIRKLVFLGSVGAIIVCGYMVSDYYLDLWMNRMKSQDVADIYHIYEPVYNNSEETQEMKRNKHYVLLDAAKKLLDINPEIVGFMTIEGTPIDVPVLQAADNSKYLDLNFRGEESRAGALFLDWRNHFDHVDAQGRLIEDNSENLVVYGHNMADESMFGSLKYYQRNADYYDKHPLIRFNSNYEYYTYKIFAYFLVDAEDESETKFDCWNHLSFTDEEDFYNFVNEAKRRSIRLTDVDVKYGDQLLTLSTCNTVLGDRGRLIIMARLVRTFEDVENWTPHSQENPNIKYPTLYYASNPNESYDPNGAFVPYGPDENDYTEE